VDKIVSCKLCKNEPFSKSQYVNCGKKKLYIIQSAKKPIRYNIIQTLRIKKKMLNKLK